MTNERRILSLAIAGAVASAVFAAPSVSTAGAVGSAASDRIVANPSCQDAGYVYGWKGDGDKVFARDCKADGWGVKVSVYYYNETAGEWQFAFRVKDSTPAGDGAWKSMNLMEGLPIQLHHYRYNSTGTKDHDWQDNCGTDCYNTSENASSWYWRVYP